jgi:hypothetical protein
MDIFFIRSRPWLLNVFIRLLRAIPRHCKFFMLFAITILVLIVEGIILIRLSIILRAKLLSPNIVVRFQLGYVRISFSSHSSWFYIVKVVLLATFYLVSRNMELTILVMFCKDCSLMFSIYCVIIVCQRSRVFVYFRWIMVILTTTTFTDITIKLTFQNSYLLN